MPYILNVIIMYFSFCFWKDYLSSVFIVIIMNVGLMGLWTEGCVIKFEL